MDIDRLARSLGASPTRRGITRVLTGIVLLGTAPLAYRDSTAKKKKCKACRFRKKGKCKGKKPDDTPCKGDGKCFDGECIAKPDCDGFEEPCDLNGSNNCCSGSCFGLSPAAAHCQPSSSGRRCLDTGDCFAGLSCIAFRCREPQ